MLQENINRVASTIITGGTWSIPETESSMNELAKIVKKLESGKPPVNNDADVNSAIYHLLGDDELYDVLDKLKEDFQKAQTTYFKSCGKAIKYKVEKMARENSDFKPLYQKLK